jgi:hypothetical protein
MLAEALTSHGCNSVAGGGGAAHVGWPAICHLA